MALPVLVVAACLAALLTPVELAGAQAKPALSLLDADNRALDPEQASLGISRHITHDRSLPRSPSSFSRRLKRVGVSMLLAPSGSSASASHSP